MAFDPFPAYFRFIRRFRFLIVLIWLGMIGIGVWRAPKLFGNLKDVLRPSAHAPSTLARETFAELGMCLAQSCVVVAQSKRGQHVLADGFVEHIWQQLDGMYGYWNGMSIFRANSSQSGVQAPVVLAERLFLSSDNSTTIFLFSNIDWLPDYMNSNLEYLNTRPDDYFIGASGPAALSHTDSTGAESDLAKMDAVSIPIALLVLAWRVWSLPLMIIPLISLPISLLFAFSLLDAASDSIKFPSFAPALFISTSVALGFDWSLFMLTRFNEGIRKGKSTDDSVQDSITYAGHTVVLSGVTLVVAYVSLLMFNQDFVVAVGKGAVITMCSCLLVNITFTPAVLLTLPCFFKLQCASFPRMVEWSRTIKCGCGSVRAKSTSADLKQPLLPHAVSSVAVDTPHSHDGGSPASDSHSEAEMVRIVSDERLPAISDAASVSGLGPDAPVDDLTVDTTTFWFRHAVRVTKRPWLSIALVLLLGSPLTIFCYRFKVTADQNAIHPRNTHMFSTWNKFVDTFAAGYSYPYALITKVAQPDNLTCAVLAVQQTNAMIAAVSARTSIDASLFSGPSWVLGKPLDLFQAASLLVGNDSTTDVGLLSQFRNLLCPHISFDKQTLRLSGYYTEVDVPWDPQGPDGDGFIRATRDVLKRYSQPGVVTFELGYGLADMVDVMDEVYDVFTLAIVASVVALLIVIGIAFRSVPTALRLVFSIVVTLTWCYGSGVIVFTTGMFDATNPGIKATKALSWLGPVLTFSLVIGLCVDYDVFLTSRIAEFRSKGMGDRDAIVAGFSQTAGVITSAGVIMVIAFGSMMLSSQMLLVECGFFLSWSIFLDTFVIRTVLCPALMALCGRYHWWPRPMPPPRPESKLNLD